MKSNPKTLDQKAMLVTLNIGMWEGRYLDKDVSADTTDHAKAERDAGRWWTHAVSRKDLFDIYSALNAARTYHDGKTLLWGKDGSRILPATMFVEYTREMRTLKEKFLNAVEAFITQYPEIERRAQKTLGDLYCADMFPSERVVRAKFHFGWHVSPLPVAGDFRVDLGAEAIGEIQADIEEQTKATLGAAMTDLWQRLYEVVAKVAEKLADPKGIFRDTLIENVVAICDLLPKLNILDDARLDAMRQTVLAKVACHDPDTLRAEPETRAAAADAAADIVKQMEAFLGKTTQ